MTADKPYRVIFALYFTLPERTALVVQLNRQGMPEVYADGNGLPRPPKRRPVDVRATTLGEWR
jgi:hypothetical protein